VLEALIRRGTPVTNPFSMELTQGMTKTQEAHRLFIQTARDTFRSAVFITSSNAVTLDGKIVSIDRAGNRVAAMVFGAPKVIIVIGRNKIVKDVHEANERIRNVIAPAHARRKGRSTPCAVTGKCCDCDSPDRLCNVTLILEKKPLFTDLSVVLVDEDLGLGWDPAWNEERIQKIKSGYYDHTWVFSVPKSR
jgi:hypothetical protein